jgi:hypothetical protein
MAQPLPEKVQTRLMNLIGMTGSDQDGEALNALRKAQALASEHKITIIDFLRGAPQPSSSSSNGWSAGDSERTRAAAFAKGKEEGVKAGYQTGYKAGYAEAAAKLQAASEPAVPASWAMFADICLYRHDNLLTAWERGFLADWLEDGWEKPTPKQLAILQRISRKCGVPVPVPV